MSGHLSQNSNGKSRCSATRRSGFSQGKYKGNGSSLVICFKGAEPLRRALQRKRPDWPSGCRQAVMPAFYGLCLFHFRPPNKILFNLYFPKSDVSPFLFGTRLENHPAIRGAVLSSTFSSTSTAGTACSTPTVTDGLSDGRATAFATGPVFGMRTMHSMYSSVSFRMVFA